MSSNTLPPVSREVERITAGVPASDGAGVRLLRVLTPDLQRRLDPFLMLDEFASDDPDDYIAGFPAHPHRGFQTVTYMRAGRIRHRDSTGNEGVIGPGGVQWMSAGRGVVHSEMPEQEHGLMHGFQLWINLPASEKMGPPGYRDIPGAAIPEVTAGSGARLRIIAGAAEGVAGSVVQPGTEPLYLDAALPDGCEHRVDLPAGHNAFVYVYAGALRIGERRHTVEARHLAVLDNAARAEHVLLKAVGDARALVVAGRPLNEPIAQWGPFVMNTREEIDQAIADYREGRLIGGP